MVKPSAGLLAAVALCVPGLAGAQPASAAETQIAMAVHAAPADRRAGAAVLGYDARGTLVELRAGKNDLICLADDPKGDGISVACYHKDLGPFMARGRELAAQGAGAKAREIRLQEVASGKLLMPKAPRMLYVTTGTRYDAATNTIADEYTRSVIYLPFATAETTGLSTNGPPSPGSPWLMDSGTAGAHIMINPPPSKKD
jgi:hypothetical protein